MKKFGKKRLVSTDWDLLRRMKAPELKSILKMAVEEYEKVKAQFSKGSAKNLFSESLENMEARLANTKLTKTAINKMTKNATAAYVSLFKDFFSKKSSTVAGARDIKRAQEVRIFGAKYDPKTGDYMRTKDGKLIPARRFSKGESETFWANYNEFMHQKGNEWLRTSSNVVQQYFGEMREARTRRFGENDFREILRRIEEDEERDIF